MAGPISGLGTGQIAQPQSLQTDQSAVRPEERRARQDNEVQARNAESAGSQKSETDNQDALRSLRSDREDEDDQNEKRKKRGSLVDITV